MVPLEVSVLGMSATALIYEMDAKTPSARRSGRIAKLHLDGANIEQLAMEVVARRLGSRAEEASP